MSEMSYKQKNKLFFKQLKEIQKQHKPDKWGPRKNKNWKKEWAPFVKYDWDFDYGFLFDLIIYKLEKMRLGLTIFTSATPEWGERIDKEITHAIELGKKLQTYDYDEEAYQFLRAHTIPYVLISKKEPGATGLAALGGEEIAKVATPRTEDSWGICEDGAANQWCAEHGVDRSTVTYAYGSDWDDEKNSKIWRKMMKAAQRAEQKDRDAFFLFISRHMKGWWD